MPHFEVGRECKTRCGYRARIYALDGEHSGTAIHGAVLRPMGWHNFVWTFEGKAYETDPVHDYDLVSSSCRVCGGSGKVHSVSELTSRECDRCRGSGFEA